MLFVGLKMSSSIGVSTLIILLLFQIHSVSCLTDDRDTSVLQTLKNSWKNSPENWIGFDPCETNWTGIHCINSYVIEIVLPNLNMEGTLPDSITTLSELKNLDLTSNPNLTGPLPTKIGDLKKLTTLHLMGCSFNGQIPDSIGGLEQLERLSLNSNKFTGTIPASIGQLSHLNWLDITDNQIEGEIPVSGSSLPGLDMLLLAQHFHFGKNKLSGHIPEKLFNPSMPYLKHVLFEGNQFTGQIPSTLSLVKSLQVLRLDRNRLTGVIPSSLNNLTNLIDLYLADNIFTGRLPNLSNMSSLCTLDVSNNRLTSSSIPSWISSLQKLKTLRMEGINLEGAIPMSLFRPLLETVILNRNWLNQTLDLTTFNGNHLELVDLQYNKVTDYKPAANKKINISLAHNPVCPEVGERQSFCNVFPRNSSFTTARTNCSSRCDHGKELNGDCHCKYPVKGTLTFRSPSFSGYSDTTNFRNLKLELDSAFENGTTYIKGSVAIRNIREDEIEHHLLIDVMIFPLESDDRFDEAGMGSVVSRFTSQNFKPDDNFGPYIFIPEKYEHPPGPKSSNKVVIIVAVVGSAFLLLLLTIAGIYALRQKERAERASEQINPFAKWDKSKSSIDAPQLMVAKAFTFEEMRRYANNFSMANDVGGGGYGQVYKGILPSGELVAIKRAQPDSLQGALEFKTEIELLSRVHHKNVVRLLGFCFDRGEQMLVYEYIPNGSLRDSLSGKNGIRLDWNRRLRIALGSGKGLAYLHELADPPIIHRDIKSSNILLDEDLTAKVADFGLSKLVSEAQNDQMTTQVKGTMGYLDPEYYMTNQLTEKSDVYGFGVVMLELLTGKIPIENGKSVVNEVKMKMKKSKKLYDLQDLLDITMMNTSEQCLEGFEMYVDLALSCVDPEGVKRPSMSEVVKEIENIMHHAGLNLHADSASNSRIYDEAGQGSGDLYGNHSFDYSASFPTSKFEPQ